MVRVAKALSALLLLLPASAHLSCPDGECPAENILLSLKTQVLRNKGVQQASRRRQQALLSDNPGGNKQAYADKKQAYAEKKAAAKAAEVDATEAPLTTTEAPLTTTTDTEVTGSFFLGDVGMPCPGASTPILDLATCEDAVAYLQDRTVGLDRIAALASAGQPQADGGACETYCVRGCGFGETNWEWGGPPYIFLSENPELPLAAQGWRAICAEESGSSGSGELVDGDDDDVEDYDGGNMPEEEDYDGGNMTEENDDFEDYGGGNIVCDGNPPQDYCDCHGDCHTHSWDYCSCSEALACCE